MNESWHIWMSHVTCEWVVDAEFDDRALFSEVCCDESCLMNESWHIWMSHVDAEFDDRALFSEVQKMSHVTCEWVMAHMNESCHMWMSHGTHEPVVFVSLFKLWHIWMSHVTCEWVMSHMNHSCSCLCSSHVSFQSTLGKTSPGWRRPMWCLKL